MTGINLKSGSIVTGLAIGVSLAFVPVAFPESTESEANDQNIGSDLVMPPMDAAAGRELFSSKGCVVCHAINGVGGTDAPALDAATMDSPMSPFDFAAKMWGGAEAMVALQREELGEPIALSGGDLANIIAFVHSAEQQSTFSIDEIPDDMKELIEHGH